MIRTFFEFLLSRSHDEGTQPNDWFRRLLLRDARLNRFDAETRQLDMLLRSTAAEQRQAMASDNPIATLTLPPDRKTTTTTHEKSTRHALAWFGGLAACALLLVALLPSRSQPTAPVVHAGELSQQLTVVPGKVLGLLTRAAQASQTQLPQLSPLANLTLPTLPAWQAVALRVESPVRVEIDFWQKGWKNLRSHLLVNRNGDPS